MNKTVEVAQRIKVHRVSRGDHSPTIYETHVWEAETETIYVVTSFEYRSGQRLFEKKTVLNYCRTIEDAIRRTNDMADGKPDEPFPPAR